MEDSREYLAIGGSSSDSCSSYLSDSEGSGSLWGEQSRDSLAAMEDPSPVISTAGKDTMLPTSVTLRFGAEQSGPSSMDDTGGNTMLRTREKGVRALHRQKRSSSSQHKSPSFRFYLTLSTLMLVVVSLTNTFREPTAIQLVIRREEVVYPLKAGTAKSSSTTATTTNQGLKLPSEVLPKYILEAEENYGKRMDTTGKASNIPNANPQKPPTRKIRSNIAMARAQEFRPVFEGADVQHFVVQKDHPSQGQLDDSQEAHATIDWISWLATVSVVAMLVEAGYKEYRHSRVHGFREQRQRRL